MSTNEPLVHVNAYIRSRGANDEERGQWFKVSGRTIRRWLNQSQYPDGWRLLRKDAGLAHAFCQDVPPADTDPIIEIP